MALWEEREYEVIGVLRRTGSDRGRDYDEGTAFSVFEDIEPQFQIIGDPSIASAIVLRADYLPPSPRHSHLPRSLRRSRPALRRHQWITAQISTTSTLTRWLTPQTRLLPRRLPRSRRKRWPPLRHLPLPLPSSKIRHRHRLHLLSSRLSRAPLRHRNLELSRSRHFFHPSSPRSS